MLPIRCGDESSHGQSPSCQSPIRVTGSAMHGSIRSGELAQAEWSRASLFPADRAGGLRDLGLAGVQCGLGTGPTSAHGLQVHGKQVFLPTVVYWWSWSRKCCQQPPESCPPRLQVSDDRHVNCSSWGVALCGGALPVSMAHANPNCYRLWNGLQRPLCNIPTKSLR